MDVTKINGGEDREPKQSRGKGGQTVAAREVVLGKRPQAHTGMAFDFLM